MPYVHQAGFGTQFEQELAELDHRIALKQDPRSVVTMRKFLNTKEDLGTKDQSQGNLHQLSYITDPTPGVILRWNLQILKSEVLTLDPFFKKMRSEYALVHRSWGELVGLWTETLLQKLRTLIPPSPEAEPIPKLLQTLTQLDGPVSAAVLLPNDKPWQIEIQHQLPKNEGIRPTTLVHDLVTSITAPSGVRFRFDRSTHLESMSELANLIFEVVQSGEEFAKRDRSWWPPFLSQNYLEKKRGQRFLRDPHRIAKNSAILCKQLLGGKNRR